MTDLYDDHADEGGPSLYDDHSDEGGPSLYDDHADELPASASSPARATPLSDEADDRDAWALVEQLARSKPDPWMLTLQNWDYWGERSWTATFTSHPLGPAPVEGRGDSPEAAIVAAAAQIGRAAAGGPNG